MKPICLPTPNAEYAGKDVIAAGWGRYQRGETDEKTGKKTGQSKVLRYVHLTVSDQEYSTWKMFGTHLAEDKNNMKDACSGDSGLSNNKWQIHFFLILNYLNLGGPLTYYDDSTGLTTLIGEMPLFIYLFIVLCCNENVALKKSTPN